MKPNPALLLTVMMSLLAPSAWAQSPICAFAVEPEASIQPTPVSTWDERVVRLNNMTSGEVSFTSSRQPGMIITLRRLPSTGAQQWLVQTDAVAGHQPSWAWTKKWGLPAMNSGAPGMSEGEIVQWMLGPDVRFGLNQVWNWLLVSTPQSPDASGNQPWPEDRIDGFDRLRYSQWGRIQSNGVDFPAQVDLVDHSLMAASSETPASKATITVHSVRLDPRSYPPTVVIK